VEVHDAPMFESLDLVRSLGAGYSGRMLDQHLSDSVTTWNARRRGAGIPWLLETGVHRAMSEAQAHAREGLCTGKGHRLVLRQPIQPLLTADLRVSRQWARLRLSAFLIRLAALFVALLTGCIPPPLTIPPHLPDTDRPTNAAGIAGSAGVLAGPTKRENSCFSAHAGWHAKGSECLPHASAFVMHQGHILGVGAHLAAGPWGIYVAPVGRVSVLDRPRHRLSLSAAAMFIAGQLDLGYSYRFTPRLAMHVQMQGGLSASPVATTAYAPIGLTFRALDHLFLFGRITPGTLVGRGDVFFMALGTAGLGVTWGEATGRDAAKVRTGELDSFEATDLRRAKLVGQDLVGSSFRSATLRSANLARSDLRSATFDDADLRDANLQRANLDHASLMRANLSGVNLAGASLREANLCGANLHDASLAQAALEGADLSGASGLTQAQLNRACGDARTRLPDGLTIAACAR